MWETDSGPLLIHIPFSLHTCCLSFSLPLLPSLPPFPFLLWYYSYQSQRATLKSSLFFVDQALKKIGMQTDEDLALLNKIFSLFLRCIELFEDLKNCFIVESVNEVQAILEEKIKHTFPNPFGGTRNWNPFYATSEIKVLTVISLSKILWN